MNIAAMIRKARKSAGLSQIELARQAGVPQSTVGRVESGTMMPSAEMLYRLLGVCRWDLVAVPRQAPHHAAAQLDEHKRPAFLWDYDMTLIEFRAALCSPDSHVRGWAFSRLLDQAHWEEIWRITTPQEVAANLPLTHFRARPIWELLLAS